MVASSWPRAGAASTRAARTHTSAPRTGGARSGKPITSRSYAGRGGPVNAPEDGFAGAGALGQRPRALDRPPRDRRHVGGVAAVVAAHPHDGVAAALAARRDRADVVLARVRGDRDVRPREPVVPGRPALDLEHAVDAPRQIDDVRVLVVE